MNVRDKNSEFTLPIGGKDFIRYYQVDYFLYKILLLKSALKNSIPSEEIIAKDVETFTTENWRRTLSLEMHFVCFQSIEALFEAIFALESLDEPNFWFNISHSRQGENFDAIEEIAKGNMELFDRIVRLEGDAREMPFLRYLFYLRTDFPNITTELDESLSRIRDILLHLAQTFTERGDYNAYKHGLRLIPMVKSMIARDNKTGEETTHPEVENSYTYIEKSNKDEIANNTVTLRTIVIDTAKDFDIVELSTALLKNIFLARRATLLRDASYPPRFFHEVDVKAAFTPRAGVVNARWTFTPSATEENVAEVIGEISVAKK
jgi:hypothetical protein